MLCEIRYQNFLSIKTPQILQLQAECLCEFHNSILEWTRLKTDVYRGVPVKILYGKSGSGKSNLLKGIQVIKNLIINGRMEEESSYESYIYQGEEAFSLGITFVYDDKVFSYDIACEKNRVVFEKLFVNKTCLFTREKQELQLYHGLKSIQIEGKRTVSFSLVKELFYESNPKELFLMNLFKTTLGVSFSEIIRDYMQNQLIFLDVLKAKNTWEYEQDIYHLLKKHEIVIDQNYELSTGMKRYFTIINQIMQCCKCGGTIIIDEMDLGIDPQWMKVIFSYLHNPNKNIGGVQLVFATYQPSYLDKNVIRRDEVIFVSKEEATTLEQLLHYAKRVNNYMRKYMNGEYGGIHILDYKKLYPKK